MTKKDRLQKKIQARINHEIIKANKLKGKKAMYATRAVIAYFNKQCKRFKIGGYLFNKDGKSTFKFIKSASDITPTLSNIPYADGQPLKFCSNMKIVLTRPTAEQIANKDPRIMKFIKKRVP